MQIINVNREKKKLGLLFDFLFGEKAEEFINIVLEKFDGPFDFGVHFGDVIFGLLTSMEKALKMDGGSLIISFYATFRNYMQENGIEAREIHEAPTVMAGNGNSLVN